MNSGFAIQNQPIQRKKSFVKNLQEERLKRQQSTKLDPVTSFIRNYEHLQRTFKLQRQQHDQSKYGSVREQSNPLKSIQNFCLEQKPTNPIHFWTNQQKDNQQNQLRLSIPLNKSPKRTRKNNIEMHTHQTHRVSNDQNHKQMSKLRQTIFGNNGTLASKAKIGIPNIGNTCYINATLQCLFHLPNFNRIFQSLQQHLNKYHKGAALRYSELYHQVINQKDIDGISTFYLKRAVSKKCSLFIQWNQQDAHEFIRQLLDSLHQDMNKIETKIKYVQLQRKGTKSLNVLANQYWNYYRKRDDSHIVDYFCGQIMNTVTCQICKTESVTFDNFLDLSLSMPKCRHSIQGLLTEFITKQYLPDLYFCSKCSRNNKCSRKLDIWRLPKLLMIHFKRFKYGKYKVEKLNQKISFPTENLDMKPYANFDTSNHLLIQFSDETTCYELTGVIHHVGNIEGGHYYAHIKDKRKWYKVDDEKVQNFYEQKVWEKLGSESAYIVFYNRIDNK